MQVENWRLPIIDLSILLKRKQFTSLIFRRGCHGIKDIQKLSKNSLLVPESNAGG
jgi:hypothetical protein